MKLICCLRIILVATFCLSWSHGVVAKTVNDPVIYDLSYQDGQSGINVTMTLPQASPVVSFNIPRSGPGTYQVTDYASYFTEVVGLNSVGENVPAKRGLGSYFEFEGAVKTISWFVDLEKMENGILPGVMSSKIRDDFLGLQGYSVFGFVTEYEANPAVVNISVPLEWPIFSSLQPTLDRPKNKARFNAENYAMLADAQYFLGKAVKIWSSDVAENLDKQPPVSLYVAAYAEAEIDISEIGRRNVLSLNGLHKYFSFTPMPFYTSFYEFLEPRSSEHQYNFSMEHMNSMTASLSADRAIVEFKEDPRIGGILHHMAHSWVPQRSYGAGYRPYVWVTAPLIETIWLNEGFAWYITYIEILKNDRVIKFFQETLNKAPSYIREKSLRELSLLGSTQYVDDFRIGMNLFSRGALFARALDEEIRKQTDGKKGFKDAFLNLYRWTQENQRGYKYEEILPIMSRELDVDLSGLWADWQGEP